jgi:DNA-binding NarL/FixJ family response regulator
VIRVFIAAPSAIVRAGLETLLRADPEIELTDRADAADVIVTDGERFEELLDLSPTAALVVLGDDPQVLRSGVRGWLPRNAPSNQIIAAVQAAAAGLVVLAADDVENILAPPRTARGTEALSPREAEVLAMIAEGHSNKAIAYRLGISEHTVKFHVNSIMTKLNAGSRTEAVTLAIRQGLIML